MGPKTNLAHAQDRARMLGAVARSMIVHMRRDGRTAERAHGGADSDAILFIEAGIEAYERRGRLTWCNVGRYRPRSRRCAAYLRCPGTVHGGWQLARRRWRPQRECAAGSGFARLAFLRAKIRHSPFFLRARALAARRWRTAVSVGGAWRCAGRTTSETTLG